MIRLHPRPLQANAEPQAGVCRLRRSPPSIYIPRDISDMSRYNTRGCRSRVHCAGELFFFNMHNSEKSIEMSIQSILRIYTRVHTNEFSRCDTNAPWWLVTAQRLSRRYRSDRLPSKPNRGITVVASTMLTGYQANPTVEYHGS